MSAVLLNQKTLALILVLLGAANSNEYALAAEVGEPANASEQFGASPPSADAQSQAASYSITASPNPVAPGKTISFSALLNPQLSGANVTVTLTFYNSAGVYAGRALTTGATFVAGQTTPLTISWVVPAGARLDSYSYNLYFYSANNVLLRGKLNAGAFSVQRSTARLTALCATAVVVGLQWTPVSGAAGYIVARNGADLTSASNPITYTSYSDQTVSPKATYVYSVTPVNAKGKLFPAAALSVKTAPASPNGDPAYCASPAIKSMTWNWSSGFNQQNSSDLWAQTWGSDNNEYGFFGDGMGYFGDTKTSFGVGELSGDAGPLKPSNALNVYGGGDGSHPASMMGKATALLAIGSDFYALGSVWQPSDPPNDGYGAPEHVEVEYSFANPYSWQSNFSAWTFCSATAAPSDFCPVSFLEYGAGYAGALDGYVYLYGMPAQNFFGNATPGPAYTYLFRVASDQLLSQGSYEAFSGLDGNGNAVWSSNWADKQPIFTDSGPRPIAISAVVYNLALGRFIAEGQGGFVNQAAFYDAPNPWGPWTSIGYYNSNVDNTAGWGSLGTTAFAFGKTGDSLGINFINKWSSSSTMWLVFSSNGVASTSARLPSLAGQSMDSFSLVSVTLNQ